MSPTRNPESFSMLDNPIPINGGGAPAPDAEPTRIKTKRRGFYVPITPDGTLDASRITDPTTFEKLKATLNVAEPAKEEKESSVKINRNVIPLAYNLLESGIQKVGIIVLKWPKDLADEMYFSVEKKEALIEPTALLIEKYSPAWLISNQELAMFCMAFTDAVQDMVQNGAARYIAKQQIIEKEQPTNGAVVTQ